MESIFNYLSKSSINKLSNREINKNLIKSRDFKFVKDKNTENYLFIFYYNLCNILTYLLVLYSFLYIIYFSLLQ